MTYWPDPEEQAAMDARERHACEPVTDVLVEGFRWTCEDCGAVHVLTGRLDEHGWTWVRQVIHRGGVDPTFAELLPSRDRPRPWRPE